MSLDDLLATRAAVLVPEAIEADALADARARIEAVGYVRFPHVDRGSYGYVNEPPVPALLAALGRLASASTGRALQIVGARALHFGPGDYLLAHHEPPATRGFEVVVDLSRSPVPGAEAHYRQHGQVFFRVPSAPGTVAIVPTNPTVTRNFSYISKRHVDGHVVRVVVALA